jgi:hypothetical protein
MNRYLPHVLILPEDDANHELANGVLLEANDRRQVQILRPAGGWTHVRDDFAAEHVAPMRRFANRAMVLLVDFDGALTRLQDIQAIVPQDLVDRVFILGSLTEPEDFRKAQFGRL